MPHARPEGDALFRSLAERLPAALCACEAPSGKVIFYNARAAELWGREPCLTGAGERFSGALKLWRVDGSPLSREKTPMALAALEGRSGRNQELVVERPDGSRVRVVANVDPIRDDEGRVVSAVGVFHEAAAPTEADEARARLAAIVTSSEDAIVSKDLNGIITSWNAGAERLFGYTASEVIGQSVTILIPPERLDEEPSILARVRRGERVEPYETIRRRKDGTLLDVSLTVSPVIDDWGRVVGASKIARDITERKRAAALAALDQAATARLYEIGKRCALPGDRFLSNLSEMLDAAIWISGADKGNVQLRDDASGTLKLVVHRGFEAPFLEYFAEVRTGESSVCGAALAAGERVVVEDVTESPLFSGEPALPVLLDAGVRAVQSTPLVSSKGTVMGMVSTHYSAPHVLGDREARLLDVLARQIADYVERKRGEEQREELLRVAERARAEAEAANRAKDEFLAMLGHELRNPLAAVASAIAAAILDEASRNRALEIAHRQTKQLGRIVDDLLDVARITHGRVPLRKTRVSLAEVLERTVETARALMDEHQHSLTLTLPPETVHLEADPARIEQAVLNLLTNAAKYTDAGGAVTVSAAREGDLAVIRVKDNGIGIAPEALPRVFDLFTQGERSLDRAQGGLGIGLTLVRRIAELHGGTVAATSPGVNRGAEFVIRLPALPATEEVAAKGPARERRPLERHPARVLMVEDNPDAAEALVMILELLGHHVRVVGDGPTALEAARANVPDIMLIDIGLPGMNGYELAQALRRETALKHVVLVAITGYGRHDDKARAMRSGFDYHLVKPVDLDALEDLVARVASPADRATASATGARH